MITIKTFIFNAFQENTYVLSDESGACIVVDPGCSNTSEQNELIAYFNQNSLKPEAIVNTHCHVDHILGCKFLKNAYNLPFYIHKQERSLLESAVEHGSFFGFEVDEPPPADGFLEQEQTFRFGNSILEILNVPGHSPGSISLYSKIDKFVITGDALFKGSIGRTDLPGGNYDQLIKNIKSNLLTLPGEVLVFPGHGPYSTIKTETDTNPFLS